MCKSLTRLTAVLLFSPVGVFCLNGLMSAQAADGTSGGAAPSGAAAGDKSGEQRSNDQPSVDHSSADKQSAELFARLDADKNGQLTSAEVPDDKQGLFRRLLKGADQNHDGSLSQAEFLSGLHDQRPERPMEEKSPAGYGGPGGLPDPDQLFARLDANRDGKVTANEVPDDHRDKFEQLLARADKDGDGALSKQEMGDGIRGFAADIKNAFAQAREPAQIFKYLDTDGDGKISADEVPEGRRPMFEKLQGRFDKDGDGKLNEEEFVAGMKVVQAFQSLFPQASPDGADAGTKTGPGDKNGTDKAGTEKRPAAKADDSKNEKRPGGKLALAGKADPDKMAQRLMKLDKNGDGKISRDEAAGPFAERFDKFDTNRDGVIDRAEIDARLALIKARMISVKPAGKD